MAGVSQKATLLLVTQGENVFVLAQAFELKGRCEAVDLCVLGFEIWVQFLSLEGVLRKE